MHASAVCSAALCCSGPLRAAAFAGPAPTAEGSWSPTAPAGQEVQPANEKGSYSYRDTEREPMRKDLTPTETQKESQRVKILLQQRHRQSGRNLSTMTSH